MRRGRRVDTVARIETYFSDFADLFCSIQNNGVLSHSATGPSHVGPRPAIRLQRNIGIAIDADGTRYLCKLPGGQHRFAIVRLLGFRIPAQLRLMHRTELAALMESAEYSPIDALLDEIGRLNVRTEAGCPEAPKPERVIPQSEPPIGPVIFFRARQLDGATPACYQRRCANRSRPEHLGRPILRHAYPTSDT